MDDLVGMKVKQELCDENITDGETLQPLPLEMVFVKTEIGEDGEHNQQQDDGVVSNNLIKDEDPFLLKSLLQQDLKMEPIDIIDVHVTCAETSGAQISRALQYSEQDCVFTNLASSNVTDEQLLCLDENDTGDDFFTEHDNDLSVDTSLDPIASPTSNSDEEIVNEPLEVVLPYQPVTPPIALAEPAEENEIQRSRKRQRNTATWKFNIQMRHRMAGEDYVDCFGKAKLARKLQ